MTKSQEIQHLISFISSLPVDSYLKHWMNHCFEEIRTDIANDIFPTALPADARRISAEIESRAKDKAADIISLAEAQAAVLVADAQRKADAIEYRMKREQTKLRQAWESLEAAF